MRKPLVIDGYCGLGGWAHGFLSEGYEAVGFDIERHAYGDECYPGQLILQDALTIHGKQFKHADCLVMSPPCQKYSYMAMPWKRSKELAAWYRESQERIDDLNALFNACFRIQREASAAAGHHIPMVVENVKGAQPWVGRAAWHFGSFYLWGDVPALMPIVGGRKNDGGSWFAIANNTTSGHGQNPDGRKVPGLNWSGSDKPGYVAKAFNDTAVARLEGTKLGAAAYQPGAVVPEGTGKTSWFFGNTKHELRGSSSGSHRRKAASAQIAKIPLPLAIWIAQCFKPRASEAA